MGEHLDNDESIIQPRKSKTDPSSGPDVLLALVPNDLDSMVRLLQDHEVVSHDMGFFRIYQAKTASADMITICGPFVGAPQAVMGMEKLIALGAKNIWVTGWCGSIQPSLRIGDLVIPASAISEEGTSRHYPIRGSGLHADQGLTATLETALRSRGETYALGSVWSTDAPYRETRNKVEAYQGKGVLAVEMEMSALMTVAIYRSVRLAGLLLVSDELFDLKWHAGFRHPLFKARRQLVAQVLLDLLRSRV